MELIAAEENKAQVREGYKKTEVGIIPIDWEVKSIGDIVSIAVGRDLKEENFSAFRTDLHQYPVFSNTVSDEGLYGFYKEPEYNGESLTVVGRGVGLGTAFKRSGGFGAIGRLLVLFPEKNIDAGFLTEYINHRVIIFSESGGIPQLTGLSLKGYKVPVPPTLKEQQAIFSALADMNALISNLDKLITKKKAIKQGAMQQLLKTPKQGGKRLPGFEGEWKEIKLEEVGQVDSESLSSNTPSTYHFKYVSLEDVNKGVLSGYTECFFGTAPSRARRVLRKNDVVFGTVRPNLQSHFFVADDVADLICSTGFAVIRPNRSQYSPRLIYHFLFSDNITRQLNTILVGSNYPAVNSRDVKNLIIHVPPTLEEQDAIATILSDMDAEIDNLVKKKSKYQRIKQGMMQELLTGKTRLV